MLVYGYFYLQYININDMKLKEYKKAKLTQ